MFAYYESFKSSILNIFKAVTELRKIFRSRSLLKVKDWLIVPWGVETFFPRLVGG